MSYSFRVTVKAPGALALRIGATYVHVRPTRKRALRGELEFAVEFIKPKSLGRGRGAKQLDPKVSKRVNLYTIYCRDLDSLGRLLVRGVSYRKRTAGRQHPLPTGTVTVTLKLGGLKPNEIREIAKLHRAAKTRSHAACSYQFEGASVTVLISGELKHANARAKLEIHEVLSQALWNLHGDQTE